jgi:hypothetical protein
MDPKFVLDMCYRKTLNWQKLSNSGDTLKNIVPNFSRKTLSGQNNYLGMVISYIMNESEMGYRGSKSSLIIPIEKGLIKCKRATSRR